jgi:type IV secretory pathway VirB3-like protein
VPTTPAHPGATHGVGKEALVVVLVIVLSVFVVTMSVVVCVWHVVLLLVKRSIGKSDM